MSPAPRPGEGSRFVTVAGGAFCQPGPAATPFVPRGVGSYPLLDHVARGRLSHVHDIFDQALALGRPLIRTHAFFESGDSPGRLRSADGTFHEPGFRALDTVLALAAERGISLLLPVANNWADYGGAPAVVRMAAPDRSDKDAFFDDPRCIRAQSEFIRHLVTRVNHRTGVRYGDDPTVFAWELCNEARLERRGAWPGFRVKRDPGRTLARWALAMRAAFDAAGTQQRVGWGGSGHRGDHGEDMDAVLASGAVHFATLHLYPFATHPWLLRVQPWHARATEAVRVGAELLRDRAALAHAHGVPLLVEELGWKTGHHTLQEERLQVMRGWLHAARSLGLGMLPWMIGERGRPDYDGLLVRPEHQAVCALLTAS